MILLLTTFASTAADVSNKIFRGRISEDRKCGIVFIFYFFFFLVHLAKYISRSSLFLYTFIFNVIFSVFSEYIFVWCILRCKQVYCVYHLRKNESIYHRRTKMHIITPLRYFFNRNYFSPCETEYLLKQRIFACEILNKFLHKDWKDIIFFMLNSAI